MKKRIVSLFLVFALCLTLLPMAIFAEEPNGADVNASSEGETIVPGGTGKEDENETPAPGGSTETGGEDETGEQDGFEPIVEGNDDPSFESDMKTEIWCKKTPDSIGRGYDGTADSGTIKITLTFTVSANNTYVFTEGTEFEATKKFDSADVGDHTVTVVITLIGDAASKYTLKEGTDRFTINGTIRAVAPDLTVTLSLTTCTVGNKLLPLLSIYGVQEEAAVTYYYTQIWKIPVGIIPYTYCGKFALMPRSRVCREAGTCFSYMPPRRAG